MFTFYPSAGFSASAVVMENAHMNQPSASRSKPGDHKWYASSRCGRPVGKGQNPSARGGFPSDLYDGFEISQDALRPVDLGDRFVQASSWRLANPKLRMQQALQLALLGSKGSEQVHLLRQIPLPVAQGSEG